MILVCPNNHNLLFSHTQSRRPIREHRRLWRRRRLKPSPAFRCQFAPFENLFHGLVSQFSSANSSLESIAPALGFASGAALYLSSRLKSKENSKLSSDVGEWILFTSPTPFNRFVILRCPSISFEGNEMLEDVNERLVNQDRHFVKLRSSGRIVRANDGGGGERESELLEYQRVCVGTDDGGVISLDWPVSLDLREEHGLDTTVLLVPGTAEGSMNASVRSFVLECLKRGCFPIVMNPRGCAGSPLTSARLFTAADSDDVCTAIQFINKARPWTTLMGVGWGYGANMLTKYLAEVGEKTPLTAATCIDNPFDLEEAARSSPYHIAINQKLTSGLIDILRSNKELFYGRTKGFDVEKALLAESVRDFEKAISMVSYGFDAIEDFYSESCTRGLVGKVKIPLLFIQNDDGTVPRFSIPRSLIAENPYTSLLLCSSSPSRVISGGRTIISWSQHCTIEWLMAVELGLLKGRHPLLQDLDITINPSKSLARVEGRPSEKVGRAKNLLLLTQSNVSNEFPVDPINKMPEEEGLQQVDNGALQQTNSIDAESLEDDEVSSVDNERGQVLQTAEVVMNMLDVTMPDTLAEEQKKKVLTAVGQGETLMKALQDAVPEDVRGKLTTAVSEILHGQGANLKLDGLKRIGQIQNVSSVLKSNIIEKAGDLSSKESKHENPSDHIERADNLGDGSDNNHPGMDQPSEKLESEHLTSENSHKSTSLGQAQSTRSDENDGFFEGNDSQYSNPNEIGPVTNSKDDQNEVDHDGGMDGLEMKEEKEIQNIEERNLDSTDQTKMSSSTKVDESPSPQGSSSESQMQENDSQKREDENSHPELNQNKPVPSDSNTPNFSVSEALDALSGMDDSTQVAVNSVFGVIEDMINHFEGENDNQNELKDRNEIQEKRTDSVSEAHQITNDHKLEKKGNSTKELSLQPDILHDSPAYDTPGNQMESDMEARNGGVEEKATNSFIGNDTNCSLGNNIANHMGKKNVANRFLVQNSNYVNNVPLYIGTNPGESFYNDRFQRYPLSKLPNSKSLDIDTTTALLLDYIPEDGKWKLLEQPGNAEDSNFATATQGAERKFQVHSSAKVNVTDKIIEPPYIILDTVKQQQKPFGESQIVERMNGDKIEDSGLKELMLFARNNILDSLKVEVSRRLSALDMKEMESDLASDMEKVANAVFLAVQYDKEHASFHIKDASEKVGNHHRDRIIKSISFAVHDTTCLRKVLPFGVIVGSSLAALRKVYITTKMDDDVQSKETLNLDQVKTAGLETHGQVSETGINHMPSEKTDQNSCLYISLDREKAVSKNLKNDTVLVGAFTAALGASALLVHQQDPCQGDETAGTSSTPVKVAVNHPREPENLEEAVSEKDQSNIVTSLAEKAMSVAGPVVPTKEDGELDQERLVAMLTDLGQRGGMLRLVGKLALLWGGIRGAMSLTDKLILFLRIAERPLFQRILAFVFMVLVLWSPVVVPLLPTLVQGWATHNSSRFAELACIVGLYTAIMILVMLWGKRIRGYDNPLEQYGLDFAPSLKMQNFVKAFVGGAMLVLLIQSVNALLGCVSLSWPSSLPYSSMVSVVWLKAYGKMLLLTGQGILTATAIALVEELLFRSWLPAEIATDLGYQRGIILSGLAFSLLQRSPQAIPGLWLLSLVLAGARQRSQGSLSIPIGLRAGIMTVSFILQMGGFLTYQPNLPFWVSGTHPFQPFSGIVGLAFSLILAVIFYPRKPLHSEKITRTI